MYKWEDYFSGLTNMDYLPRALVPIICQTGNNKPALLVVYCKKEQKFIII